jgi:hypothetical protein
MDCRLEGLPNEYLHRQLRKKPWLLELKEELQRRDNEVANLKVVYALGGQKGANQKLTSSAGGAAGKPLPETAL